MKGIAAVIIFLAAVLFTVQLGQRSLTSEEVRWGQIAREMRQSGEWFHPTINGRLYYDKPLASYWFIVAMSSLTGRVDEFTVRLPSALAGLLSVILTIRLGRLAYDFRHGLLAATILTTMFGFTVYSRRACADMENLAGILAAITLFAQMRTFSRTQWVVVLWLIMGVTSSMKGLLGFALPVLIIGVDCTGIAVAMPLETGSLFRRWIVANRWFFNRWSLLAVPLGVSCFIAPYIVSSINSGSDEGLSMVFRENLQRFVSPHNHTGPVTLYLGVIVLLAAPWSLYLPAALIPQAKRGERDGHRLMVIFFWATFLFFTASASRRSYYLLPILPAASLLISRLLLTPTDELRPLARRLRNLGGLLYALLILTVVVALALPANIRPAPYDLLPEIPGRVIVIVLGMAASIMLLRQLWMPSLALLSAVAYGSLMLMILVLLPVAEEHRTRRDFAREVRDLTQQNWPRLALFHARDIVFELETPQPLLDFSEPERLSMAFQNGTIGWAIVRRRYLPLISFRYEIIHEEAAYPWEGIDHLGDKMTLITWMEK